MKKFRYKAKDTNGKTVMGFVEAASDMAAAKLLRNRGFIVIDLKPSYENLFSIFSRFTKRVTSGDVTNFTRQMSTMINAGLPITESLVILRTQSKPSFSSLVTQILADVEGGESLSNSLSKFPKVFSPTYIALVKAGETGGVLDKILLRLADNMERSQEFKGKVKSALVYPIIIVIGMLVVSAIMMIFVIPRMTDLYTQFDAELPFTTKILISTSNFSQKFWPLILLSVVVGIFLIKAYAKTKSGRNKIDSLLLNIPLIWSLNRQVILTELTRTLSLMVGSGVAILDGLKITRDVIRNSVIAEAMDDVSLNVAKGFPIAYSFAKHAEAFPFILPQMIAVGEETGKMDEVLSKVSHVFETESEQKLKALTAAIEPIIMIFLGIGVGFLVISVIMPIYNLTTTL